MKIQFTNVGHTSACFTVDMKVLSRNSLLREVKPHVKSKIIQFDYDEDKNEGKIYVGILGRPAGEFKAID